jgi:hypothetical protein
MGIPSHYKLGHDLKMLIKLKIICLAQIHFFSVEFELGRAFRIKVFKLQKWSADSI